MEDVYAPFGKYTPGLTGVQSEFVCFSLFFCSVQYQAKREQSKAHAAEMRRRLKDGPKVEP